MEDPGLKSEKTDIDAPQWIKVPHDMIHPRQGHAVESVGDAIYAIGGLESSMESKRTRSVERRMNEASPWEQIGSVPGERCRFVTVAVGRCIYAFDNDNEAQDGENALDYVYDCDKNTWSQLPPRNLKRTRFAVCALRGLIYVIGGKACYNGSNSSQSSSSPGYTENSETSLSAVEVFDPSTSMWRNVSPMSFGRCNPSACSVNGFMYVLGGTWVEGHNTFTGIRTSDVDSMEIYNPAVNSWTTKLQFGTSFARRCSKAFGLKGYILVVGGLAKDTSCWAEESPPALYNLQTGSWTQLPVNIHDRSNSSACVIGQYLYRIGGDTMATSRSAEKLQLPASLDQFYHPIVETNNISLSPSPSSFVTGSESVSPSPPSSSTVSTNNIESVGAVVKVYQPKKQTQKFNCPNSTSSMQLASRVHAVNTFCNTEQLHTHIAASFGISKENILYCTRDRLRFDASTVVLEDSKFPAKAKFFAHLCGRISTTTILKELALGLSVANTGAGRVIVLGISVDLTSEKKEELLVGVGDVIQSVNGKCVNDAREFDRVLGCIPSGQTVELEVIAPKIESSHDRFIPCARGPLLEFEGLNVATGTNIHMQFASDVCRLPLLQITGLNLYAHVAIICGVSASTILYCTRDTCIFDSVALILSDTVLKRESKVFAHIAGRRFSIRLKGTPTSSIATVDIGNGKLVVERVAHLCEAYKAGVRAGDVIESISTSEMSVCVNSKKDFDKVFDWAIDTRSEVVVKLISPKRPWVKVDNENDSKSTNTRSRIQVEGAGGFLPNGIDCGKRCNGVYEAVDEVNGRSFYRKINGTAIIYFAKFWKINYSSASGGWCYALSDARGYRVPLGQWRSDNFNVQDFEGWKTPVVSEVH